MDELEDVSQATAHVAIDVDKQTTSVHYTRLFNLGNYENEKIGITIEVLPGQAVQDVIEAAEKEVKKQHEDYRNIMDKIEEARTRLWETERRISEREMYQSQLEQAIKDLEEAHPEAVEKAKEAPDEEEDDEDWSDEEDEDYDPSDEEEEPPF